MHILHSTDVVYTQHSSTKLLDHTNPHIRAITGLQISAMDETTRGWFRYKGMFGQANFKLDIITKIVLISYDMH